MAAGPGARNTRCGPQATKQPRLTRGSPEGPPRAHIIAISVQAGPQPRRIQPHSWGAPCAGRCRREMTRTRPQLPRRPGRGGCGPRLPSRRPRAGLGRRRRARRGASAAGRGPGGGVAGELGVDGGGGRWRRRGRDTGAGHGEVRGVQDAARLVAQLALVGFASVVDGAVASGIDVGDGRDVHTPGSGKVTARRQGPGPRGPALTPASIWLVSLAMARPEPETAW